MERIVGDRMREYYSTWLATSISCCFPRPQERPQSFVEDEEEGTTREMEQEETTLPQRATTVKRQSPIPVSKYNKSSVCYQQPSRRSQLSWPVFEAEDPRIQPPRASMASSRHREQKTNPERDLERKISLVSRASQRTRPKSRKSTSRRLTISKPTDFRRSDASFDFIMRDDLEPLRSVSPLQRRLSPFRPIQLSIYMPGNELPPLPKFSDDSDDEDDVPPVPGIERPAQALMKIRSEPQLTRQLSSFSIPRKPIGSSRANSMELAPRTSIDSGLTLHDASASLSTHKRSTSIDRLPPHPSHRPSLSATHSSRDFLEIINAPLPPLPQSTSTSHHNTETDKEYCPRSGYSMFRSASEQNTRLRTHLEERAAVLATAGHDCDTISEKEERSPVSPLTPPQHQASTFPTIHRAPSATEPSQTLQQQRQIFIEQSLSQQRDSSNLPRNPPTAAPTTADSPAWNDSAYDPRLHKARSSSGSSTLLNEKLAEASPSTREPPNQATVTTIISVPPQTITTTPTLSARLSQWLARSITSIQSGASGEAPPHTFRNSSHSAYGQNTDLTFPAPLTLGAGAVPLPGQVHKAKSAPSSGPKNQGTHHTRQQSSKSTFVASGSANLESVDMEKFAFPIPTVTERRVSSTVGVAF